MPRALAINDARNVLATVHGFDPLQQRRGKEGALAVLEKLQCIQSDPIDVAGRNSDLTLQSRVIGYRRQHLQELLYRDRRLFEYFCKMHSIMPVELFPVFRHKMDAFWRNERVSSFFKKHRTETALVLEALEKGPASSRELGGTGRMRWGWGHEARISNIILTRLWVAGKAVIWDRDGGVKYYSLPERVIPKRLLNAAPPEEGEDIIEIAKAIVRASRLVIAGGSPEQWSEVGKTKAVGEILRLLETQGEVFPIQLEGSGEKFYAPSADRNVWESPQRPESDYVRLLAPLDPMLWSRRVFKAVYGCEYHWEVYKKPANRRYGYYCLPVMFNGQYVGLIDPFFRKKDHVLEIRNLHTFDPTVPRGRFLRALRAEIGRFCDYLGAEKTEVKKAPAWVAPALSARAAI